MNPSIQFQVLVCFALSQTAQALNQPLVGGYCLRW